VTLGTARPLSRARRIAVCGALGALLSGCAVGQPTEVEPTPSGPLGQAAVIQSPSPAGASSAPGGASDPVPGEQGGSGASDDPGIADETSADAPEESASVPPAATWRDLLRHADPADDHGRGADYADLTALIVRESGPTVEFTAVLAVAAPKRLVDGETEGVGFDIFRTGGTESDYQVFLDGGVSGWTAYLQGPDGFIPFPGTFTIAGRDLIARVPWSSIGGRGAFETSVFLDWSSADLLASASSDLGPDAGRLAVQPS
jgi:hypothetical protein